MSDLWNKLFNILITKFKYKEFGDKSIGETFYRVFLYKDEHKEIYLHKFNTPRWHKTCHNHPWDFTTHILAGGYWEKTESGVIYRPQGSILFRNRDWMHDILADGFEPDGFVYTLVEVSNFRNDITRKECGNV